MAQFGRPDSDVAGGWDSSTGGDHFSQINDVTPVNTTNIQEDDGSTVELGLSDVTDPAVSSDHILRVYAYRSSNKANTLTFVLFQGAVEIATNSGVTVSNTTPGQAYTYTLSGAEADAISDYSDLRIKLTAAATNPTDIFVTNVELEVPSIGASRRIFVIS